MTDLQFLERLRDELAEWPDVQRVLTSADDPALSSNELRVIPVSTRPRRPRIDVFRVIVEWETAPIGSFS